MQRIMNVLSHIGKFLNSHMDMVANAINITLFLFLCVLFLIGDKGVKIKCCIFLTGLIIIILLREVL